MLLGSALNPVNSSVIATALVPIAAALHVPVGRTAVLVSVLYLATSIAQPTAGKLSEEFGPRRVFLAGIVTVLAGGLLGGFAQNLAELVVARVLIGVGTSAGYPSAMLLVRRRSDQAGLDAPPGSVLGGLVIAGIVTAAIGLPIGGLLVQAWGWRTTFFVNVPVTLITLPMALAWIPRDPRAGTRRTVREVAARIDVAGIAGFGATIAALLVFLLSLPNPDWAALAISVVAGAALVAWELRADRPFFDVRLLATNRALTRTYLRFAVTMLCIYTVFYGVTQWMKAGRGLSSMATGLVLLPMSVLSGVIARPVSRRNLLRTPLILGAVCCLAGSAGVLLLSRGHAGRLDRGRHPDLRRHQRRRGKREPDRPVRAGTRRGYRNRFRPAALLRLHRVDRVLGDHRDRVPHPCQRPRPARHRDHHDRGQRRGAGPHPGRPPADVAASTRRPAAARPAPAPDPAPGPDEPAREGKN